MSKNSLQKYDCDRCGLTFKKDKLKRQNGLLVCEPCFDDSTKIQSPDLGFSSPRDNSLNLDPVYDSNIFSVVEEDGVDVLMNSINNRSNPKSFFLMFIQGFGGSVDISANPQIVPGLDKDNLTLKGKSNTNTVKFHHGDGLNLINGEEIILKDGDTITLTFSSHNNLWNECSRNLGGI